MKLFIKNLKAETIIGVLPEERKDKQKVTLDLEVTYDAIVRKDKLEETLDYADIERKITASLAKQKFHLIESLAEHIAHLVLAYDKVQDVCVWLGKPGALKSADNVVLEYRLSR
ncbi:MAG: dihydroneopterin aldolase [Alphaproteobacteria bacterium]